MGFASVGTAAISAALAFGLVAYPVRAAPAAFGTASASYPCSSPSATPTSSYAWGTSTSSSTSSTTSPYYCENAKGSRQCWGQYDISTDYYNDGPRTGVTRTYSFTVARATIAPDGFPRDAVLVNGMLPGPTIEADWGDVVEVHVENQIADNGTAVHFHGVRQHGTGSMDGVPGVTQCALAPGDTQVYRWVAEQYGYSWYHSHFSLQYGNGLLGPLLVRGPTTSDYDEELEPLVIMDWYHNDSFYLHSLGGPPPPAESALINGKGQFNGTAYYHETTVTSGKKYLLRLVNSGTFTHMKFWVDGHKLTVVSADFVAVEPYEVDYLDVALGQRYIVILDADQPPDNYWIRAVPQITCTAHQNPNGTYAILRYDSAEDPTALPSDLAPPAYTDGCGDQTLLFTPALPVKFGYNGTVDPNVELPVALASFTPVKWTLNFTSFDVDWSQPSLGYADAGTPAAALPPGLNSVALAGGPTDWAVFTIDSQFPAAHPLHVHGHDWFVLATGTGNFSGDVSEWVGRNVPRRDVVILPVQGYAVFGLPLDNPGVWLMHCHIAFHAAEGLALEFLERADEIPGKLGVDDAWHQTCENWAAYAAKDNVTKDDSGV
ncbi:hypothetical protein HK405_002827 [Cladochytrium tenue]|nr:hypothetical protein HK405_002827 [Cladochytrium tenue]